jgi:hypothetical protein
MLQGASTTGHAAHPSSRGVNVSRAGIPCRAIVPSAGLFAKSAILRGNGNRHESGKLSKSGNPRENRNLNENGKLSESGNLRESRNI